MTAVSDIKSSDTKKLTSLQRVMRPGSVRSGNRKLSTYIQPMLAGIHDQPFDNPDWLFEIKWDGYRAIAEIKKEIKLYSRNGLSFLERYPKVAAELHLPLAERKKIAEHSIPDSRIIKYSDHVTADGILRHPVFVGLRIDKSAEETNTIDAVVKKSVIPSKAMKTKKKNEPKQDKLITVNGHQLKLTNLNKIYFPEDGITKGDVINYYSSVHKYILPYLKNRPQSLKRNPNGINEQSFYQKEAGNVPDWIQTERLRAESVKKNIDYIICNNMATLLYLNNLGCIELNPWNSRISSRDYPDYLVMDIDPAEQSTFDQVIEAALVIKEILHKAGAPSYCKTSGATGLHIYIPLKAQYTYDEVRSFAELIAVLANEQLPDTTTVERPLEKRAGKIYLDYLQNKKGQTLASVYSLRPKAGATISTPLTWKEVRPGLHPSMFTIKNIASRLDKTGDLFAGVLKEKINLKKSIKNLEN